MPKSPEPQAVEVKDSLIGGLGLFALRPFAPDESIRVCNIVREITIERPLQEAAGERHDHCAYPDGKIVLYGFPDRHMNHSCDPNCYYQYGEGNPVTVARRNITTGEELTVDYLINTAGGDSWPCNCRAARCRGKTCSSFFDLPLEIQIEYRPLLAPWFTRRFAESPNCRTCTLKAYPVNS